MIHGQEEDGNGKQTSRLFVLYWLAIQNVFLQGPHSFIMLPSTCKRKCLHNDNRRAWQMVKYGTCPDSQFLNWKYETVTKTILDFET